MPEPIVPIAEPSILNQPPVVPPAEVPPESKLFPEPVAPKVEPTPTVVPSVTPPEPKKDEPKPGDPKPNPPAANAPVDYESLKLPEGSLLSTEELAVVKKEAKEQGLTLEEAQGVLEVKNDSVKTYAANQKELVTQAQQTWKKSWENDPDYGGDKLAESTELAKRAWDKLADPELKQWADQTGLGSNNLVLRMMARIGKMFSEDQLIRGGLGGVPEEISPEERMYGKTTPTKK